MELNIIKQLFMTHGFCTSEEISGWAPIVWIGGYSYLEKKKILSSVDMCFLYLVVLHAESEKWLDSADLSISISEGMPQVKML